MNLLEIVLLLIVLLLFFRGIHDGIIRMSFGLIGLVIMIFAISEFSPMLHEYLKDKNNVQEEIHKIADKYVSSREENARKSDSEKGKDYLVNESANEIPQFMREVLVKELEKIDIRKYSASEVEKMTHDALVVTVADLITKGLAVLITLILASVLFFIVRILLGILGHLPIVHGVSKLLGGVMGFIEGIIVVWIILFLIQCFAPTSSINTLYQMEKNSEILTEINDFNPLFKIF